MSFQLDEIQAGIAGLLGASIHNGGARMAGRAFLSQLSTQFSASATTSGKFTSSHHNPVSFLSLQSLLGYCHHLELQALSYTPWQL